MTTGSAGSPGGGPIRGHVVGEALLGPDGSAGLWTSVRVVASTGSTNADLLARGGPEGQVLVADEQTAGRGRAGRTWVSVPGASLTFSVLLRAASVPPRCLSSVNVRAVLETKRSNQPPMFSAGTVMSSKWSATERFCQNSSRAG